MASVPVAYFSIKCLVVDDEASMRSTIKHMMTKIGFKNINTAENGRSALDYINSSKVDLVICDVNMPEMSGTELFNTIKANRKHDNVSFIFVTAETTRDVVARVAEHGADDYIIKPFLLATLEDKISKVLKRKYNPSGVETQLKSFRNFLNARSINEAEDALKKAAELSPDSPVIIFNSGQLALAKGEVNKAISLFKEAIEKKPLFVKAYNALGEIHEQLGDIKTAIQYYEQAHNISPGSTERLITLSKLYSNTGSTEKAEILLKDAIANVREDLSTSNHLIGEMLLAKNDNEKALDMLLKAHQKNPQDIKIMFSLADAYRKTDKAQEALNVYENMLRIAPNNAAIHYNMGKAYIEMGVKNKAIQSMKKAWELNPFSKEITTDLKALAEKDRFDL
ncbi:MAG: tetratricopeptide repeat protein [Dissulfurispiraceae bacterium]|jgi:two-component system chemotaxis response regulator CheY|nr:tetratricopeptide repeat protein [Dissulfurispiraceae bacterium]